MFSQTIIDFTGVAAEVLKKAAPIKNTAFHIDIVINPVAGVFKSPNGMKRAIADLRRFYVDTYQNSIPGTHDERNSLYRTLSTSYNSLLRTDSGLGTVRLHVTRSRDHIEDTVKFIAGDVESNADVQNILMLAGGDGFHKHICTALVRQYPKLLDEIILMRLPMGTGNDSSDVPDLYTAARLLTQGCEAQYRPIIRISPSGAEEDYAFNIASLGLDAFVCIITEKTKRLFPGNVYRVITNMIVPFYDLVYPLRAMQVEITGKDGTVTRIDKKMLLTVLGASGRSDYGGGLHVLPNDSNFCTADAMGLLKKLKAKRMLYVGDHGKMNGVDFHAAKKLTIGYPADLPMELDGEVLPLKKENFPLTLEVLDNRLRVFRQISRSPLDR